MRKGKNSPCDRLIVFGRYPVPGKTKTRLIPALGPAGAAALQRKFTEETLKTIRASVPARRLDVEFRFEGGDERRMHRWLGSDLIFAKQGQGDLGERMHAAFMNASERGCARVVLIGTDVPQMTTGHLLMAFEALREHDLVLGPSTDGGYWLMGLKRPVNLFQGIAWGKDKVLDQTAALAKRLGLRTAFLSPMTDMDTVNDLKKWQPGYDTSRPYISVIIPALNEAHCIERAVQSARDRDAEVVVVDGGSHDDTETRAREAGARVESTDPGRARQQNRGAASSRGCVLLFLHADTRLPKGYVAHVFETLMDRRTLAGAFRFKTDLASPSMKVIESLANLRSEYLHLPYGDQGLFMRKKTFALEGGFPDVPIAEDLFLVRQLSKHGRIRIAPAAVRTSARRWQEVGLFHNTLINLLITGGCYLGVSKHILLSLHRYRQRR